MRAKGFTLVELLITVALISVIGLVAFPGIKNLMRGYEMRGAARQIYSDLQMARLGAIKEGRQWRLVFTPGNDAFSSYVVQNGAGESVKTVAIGQTYSEIAFNENFPSGTVATFSPNGSASSGNVTLTRGTRNLYVRVNSASGNIRITETP